LPAYYPLGGPQGKGHVSFDRAQSQYLDAGPRTLNIATNGGLTIVAVVRFTGTVGDSEKIIGLGSASGYSFVDWSQPATYHQNTIILGRFAVTSSIRIQISNGGVFFIEMEIPFVQGSWLTVVVRYLASTRECVLKVNNDNSAGTASEALTDRTVSQTYMGKSHWNDPYFNGDMAGVFVVDEYLSAETASAIADDMVQGVDLSNSELCKTGPCVRCEAGTYKRTVGWSSALTVRPPLYVC
jgi:hypothetical protein